MALLLQVNQTIPLKSGVQAFTCPEGFASPLAPVVQKDSKATPCVMTHVSKHFPGIPVVKVVAPSAKDAVYLGNRFHKRLLVSASSLLPDFLLKYSYGLLARDGVEIIPIPPTQVTVIAKRESQKVQALFLVHSDNTSFVPVYAESKDCLQFLFQPAGYALAHKPGHNNEIVGKPYHPRSGKMIRAVCFFVKRPVKPMKIDVSKQGRNYPALRSALFGTADAAVLFNYRTLKPLPDQFQDTSVGYPPLKFYHQLLVRNAVKVTRKIRIIHLPPSELEVAADLVKGSMCAPFGAKTVGTVEKVHLKDRFEDNKYGCLNDSVPHAGYAERSQFAVGLGDVGAANRGWFIALGAKAFLNCVQVVRYAACLRLDVLDTYAIDPRSSLVGPYSRPRRFEYVTTNPQCVAGFTISGRLATVG